MHIINFYHKEEVLQFIQEEPDVESPLLSVEVRG